MHFLPSVAIYLHMTSSNLVGAKFFLYFSHILLNFWMSRGLFHFAFAIEKQNNMSFVKSVFKNFLTYFILGSQIMMCPKSVYCYNQAEIPSWLQLFYICLSNYFLIFIYIEWCHFLFTWNRYWYSICEIVFVWELLWPCSL